MLAPIGQSYDVPPQPPLRIRRPLPRPLPAVPRVAAAQDVPAAVVPALPSCVAAVVPLGPPVAAVVPQSDPSLGAQVGRAVSEHDISVTANQETDGTARTLTLTVRIPHGLKFRRVEVDFDKGASSSSSAAAPAAAPTPSAEEVAAVEARTSVQGTLDAFDSAVDLVADLACDLRRCVSELP